MPFRHPSYNLSSTFKKYFTIPLTLTPAAKLLPFTELEDGQNLYEDFNIDLVLISEAKWVDVEAYDLSL